MVCSFPWKMPVLASSVDPFRVRNWLHSSPEASNLCECFGMQTVTTEWEVGLI